MLDNRQDGGTGSERIPFVADNGNVRFFAHSTHFFRHHIPTDYILLGVIESFLLLISFYIGIELRHQGALWHGNLGALFPTAVLFCVVMLLSLIAFGAYQRQSSQSPSMLVVRIGGSMLAGMVVLGVIFYVVPTMLIARGALVLSVFASFVMVMACRLVFQRISSAYDMRQRVLVLGSGKRASQIRAVEQAGAISEINIVYYMPMPGDADDTRSISLASTPGTLSHYVRNNHIDLIVLAMDDRRNGLPVHELLDCKMGGIEVLDLLSFFERQTSKIRLDIMQPSWLFLSDGFQVNNFRRMWKRLFDIFSVMLLAPVVLPVVLLAAFAILVESGGRGGIFYSQTRVGQGGRVFQIYKFRSMVVGAEEDGVPRWAQKNDSRITRVGAFLRKFRLDEVPQLYNILKGDMSFVGPRPERPEFVQRLAEKIPYYNERHRVKPGLSGWAQIRYPYGASEEDGYEKLQYDLYYVKNYSILLDALILLQTAEVVLLGRGSH